MTPEELEAAITALGYEFRSVRCFKNTFHVTFWTKQTKQTHHYRVPLSQFTMQDVYRFIAGYEPAYAVAKVRKKTGDAAA